MVLPSRWLWGYLVASMRKLSSPCEFHNYPFLSPLRLSPRPVERAWLEGACMGSEPGYIALAKTHPLAWLPQRKEPLGAVCTLKQLLLAGLSVAAWSHGRTFISKPVPGCMMCHGQLQDRLLWLELCLSLAVL